MRCRGVQKRYSRIVEKIRSYSKVYGQLVSVREDAFLDRILLPHEKRALAALVWAGKWRNKALSSAVRIDDGHV
jgi:hypothetical protein